MTATTATLASFLLDRLREDEEVARAAIFPQAGGEWTSDIEASVYCENLRICQPAWTAHAEHLARHDPARVLAEVAAKRVAVDWYLNDDDTVMEATICALASVYRDHPDWREEWA